MDSKKFIEDEKQIGANYYKPLPVVLEKGDGVWLWDIEGKKYLDFMSAYSAVSFGHKHPRIVKALTEQANQLAVTSRAFHTAPMLPFLNKICELTGLQRATPMNSGAEAVETAIKAARKWGYEVKGIPDNQAEIIVAEGNFHGRTTTISGFSSEPGYKKHFGPFSKGFVTIPFADMPALEKAITPNTCAVLFEPVLGEGGLIFGPNGWLRHCQEICQANNVLMILDEIQSGMGRTGRYFAYQHEGITPDGVTVGKALGGGLLPVSAFVTTHEVMDVYTPGTHGSTFGGNPLAARVALEAMTVLQDEHLAENSAKLGPILIDSVQSLKHPLIKAVRGQGLWVGVEIVPEVPASKVCHALMAEGVLTKEAHDTVIRIAPPLVIDEETLRWGVGQLKRVLDAM